MEKGIGLVVSDLMGPGQWTLSGDTLTCSPEAEAAARRFLSEHGYSVRSYQDKSQERYRGLDIEKLHSASHGVGTLMETMPWMNED